MADDIPEFTSSLRENAHALHELFTEMVNAGFTEDQACKILGVFLGNRETN